MSGGHRISVPVAGAAALFVSFIAGARDFRALDFGAACDQLAALEQAQGFVPLEGTPPSGYAYAFRGRYMERDAIVGYACREGVFIRGAYIFPAMDQADASSLYQRLKAQETRAHGKPSFDFASPEYRAKMKALGATLSVSDTEVAFWMSGNTEAHLSVAEPSRTRGWQVSLSYQDVTRVPGNER